MGWTTQEKKDKSKLRRLIHAKYHTYIGDQKKKRGNFQGAEAEYKRAQEHREKAKELSFFGWKTSLVSVSSYKEKIHKNFNSSDLGRNALKPFSNKMVDYHSFRKP